MRDPTDEELLAELAKHPMPPGHTEIGKMVMPFSIDEYFKLFHDVDAPYTFDKYYIYRGYKKINVTHNWVPPPNDPDINTSWGNVPINSYKRIEYEVDVVGNPFVKLTPTTKNFMLVD